MSSDVDESGGMKPRRTNAPFAITAFIFLVLSLPVYWRFSDFNIPIIWIISISTVLVSSWIVFRMVHIRPIITALCVLPIGFVFLKSFVDHDVKILIAANQIWSNSLLEKLDFTKQLPSAAEISVGYGFPAGINTEYLLYHPSDVQLNLSESEWIAIYRELRPLTYSCSVKVRYVEPHFYDAVQSC